MAASASGNDYRRRAPSAARDALEKFLKDTDPTFREYEYLRSKVDSSQTEKDRTTRERAKSDNPTNEQEWMYYDGLKKVAREIHEKGRAFSIDDGEFPPNILDLCMAPGAFLGIALDVTPEAHAVAFSLPSSEGGFTRILPPDERVVEAQVDITTLLADIGIPMDSGPSGHYAISSAMPRQLKQEQKFQLILCDGSLLRTQRRRLDHQRERRRLLLSQLCIALQHIRSGGTMIVLLYGIEKWETAKLLYEFGEFSEVSVYKPRTSHRRKPSFYMIAREVRPKKNAAANTLGGWQEEWKRATFDSQDQYQVQYEPSMAELEMLIHLFGDKLKKLGSSVWTTQSMELTRMLSGPPPAMSNMAQNF